MNKAYKATLLSALIFPGLGHLMLKKHPQAIFFLGTTSYACYLLLASAIAVALQIVSQVESGKLLKITDILHFLADKASSGYSAEIQYAMLWVLLSWLVATLDTYRLDRQC